MMRTDQTPKAVLLKDYQPPAYWIDSTDLIFEIDEAATLVKSHLSMRKNKTQPACALTLHGNQLQLQTIAINGITLSPSDYTLTDEDMTIHCELADEFTLYCETMIKPQENTSLEGLYQSGGMFCTQCEAEGFRKITYYLDRPDVMSRFTTTIIADKKRYPVLLSNGNEVISADIGDDKHCVTWEDPFKKPAYLFALVAGNLVYQEDYFTTQSGRKVTLRLFVEPFNQDKCDHALQSLKKSMKWDEEVYGREYDLDIFMIVAVDHFNMGAMENKGLNIFNSSCVLAKPETTTDEGFERIESIVAHEYFHNWSGNRVTCRDWFQLSLKEGFTVFRDQQFSSDMNSATVERIGQVSFLRTAQFAEDAGPMAHPVRPASYIEISNFYTLTVYEKGAEVVRMLHTLLGADLFRKGSDHYFATYDGQAVTTDDFVRSMEVVSKRDFTQFKRWYDQSGTPILQVTDRYDAQTQQYFLTIEQTCPPTPQQPVKQPFHIPVKVGFLNQAGETQSLCLEGYPDAAQEWMLEVTQATHTFVFTKASSKPVPSLLRHFSAPVKLHYPYHDDDLLLLMQHDVDGFNRWDAGQRLAVLMFEKLIQDYRAGRELQLNSNLVTAYQKLLSEAQNSQADYLFIAQLLTLPSESYLAELADEIDVDAIYHVHYYVRKTLAALLKDELLQVYRLLLTSNTAGYDGPSSAARALKNTCLHYLMTLTDGSVLALCIEQFNNALNMTDAKSAFAALVNMQDNADLKKEVVNAFYEKWRDDVLVIEQWFAVQAASPSYDLQRIEQLLAHPAFEMTNPNIVRAVIATFANRNHIQFHDLSGSGYEFLADQILALNKLNPQIAARLLTPLTRWKKYGSQRQHAMKAALSRILQCEHLSKDVYEIVSKSLS